MLGIRSFLDLSINNTNVIVRSHTSSMSCNLGISNEHCWEAILLILTFRSRQEKKRGRRDGGRDEGRKHCTQYLKTLLVKSSDLCAI